MPILTLKDAVEYVKTSKATDLLLVALRSVTRIFTFNEERNNRASRYVAVLSAYKKGVPINAIMEQYGCSKRTIYDYVERAGIDRRTFVPKETKAQIVQHYKDGIPTIKIAELNGVSLRYVMQVAKEAGLSRKKRK